MSFTTIAKEVKYNTNPNAKKPVVCKETKEEWESLKKASEMTKIPYSTLSHAITRETSIKGLNYKYK